MIIAIRLTVCSLRVSFPRSKNSMNSMLILCINFDRFVERSFAWIIIEQQSKYAYAYKNLLPTTTHAALLPIYWAIFVVNER